MGDRRVLTVVSLRASALYVFIFSLGLGIHRPPPYGYSAEANRTSPTVGVSQSISPSVLPTPTPAAAEPGGVEAPKLVQLGESYEKLGLIREARDAYARALEIDPSLKEAFVGLERLSSRPSFIPLAERIWELLSAEFVPVYGVIGAILLLCTGKRFFQGRRSWRVQLQPFENGTGLGFLNLGTGIRNWMGDQLYKQGVPLFSFITGDMPEAAEFLSRIELPAQGTLETVLRVFGHILNWLIPPRGIMISGTLMRSGGETEAVGLSLWVFDAALGEILGSETFWENQPRASPTNQTGYDYRGVAEKALIWLLKTGLPADPGKLGSRSRTAFAEFFAGYREEQSRNQENAIWHYSRALNLDAGFWVVLYNRGRLYQGMGKGYYGKATSDYHRVLSLAPKLYRALWGLGNIAYEEHRWAEAEAKYRQALSIPGIRVKARDEYDELQVLLARALLRHGMETGTDDYHELSRTYLSEVETRWPWPARVAYLLADYYLQTREFHKCEEILDKSNIFAASDVVDDLLTKDEWREWLSSKSGAGFRQRLLEHLKQVPANLSPGADYEIVVG